MSTRRALGYLRIDAQSRRVQSPVARPSPGPDSCCSTDGLDRPTADAWLDCERLDVYRLAVEFQAIACRLCRNRRLGSLRDQLDRASVSIVLNIAEGVGRTNGSDRARFLAIARGSATECAAVLDLLLARGVIVPSDHRHGRGLLIRVVQMLTRLAARCARPGALS